MEKLEIISSVGLWIDMREVRNRIAHDYLPGQIKHIYDEIMGAFGLELRRLAQRSDELRRRIDSAEVPGTGQADGA